MAKDALDADLVETLVCLSQNDAEEIITALWLRWRQLESNRSSGGSYITDDLGKRLSKTFEDKFGTAPDWWERKKNNKAKVTVKASI